MTPTTNPPTERLTAEALAKLRKHLDKWNDQYDGYPASWNTVNALLADRDALAADLRNAEGWIADVEEREAACCPEDVGFDEYIRHLQAELQEWRGFHNRLVDDIRDLANLITGGYANGKTQDEMLGYLRSGITRMSAELQEAREQGARQGLEK